MPHPFSRRLFSSIIVCALVCLGRGGIAVFAAEPTWKAGAATVEITPAEPQWMAGYGNRDHPAEGTLHP
ncbi:MAG TPA: hypothetical protein VM029_18590, partial [Opitutaceae bacterium]|nr:hypothetical protein [Opitutaceae bacterium]